MLKHPIEVLRRLTPAFVQKLARKTGEAFKKLTSWVPLGWGDLASRYAHLGALRKSPAFWTALTTVVGMWGFLFTRPPAPPSIQVEVGAAKLALFDDKDIAVDPKALLEALYAESLVQQFPETKYLTPEKQAEARGRINGVFSAHGEARIPIKLTIKDPSPDPNTILKLTAHLFPLIRAEAGAGTAIKDLRVPAKPMFESAKNLETKGGALTVLEDVMKLEPVPPSLAAFEVINTILLNTATDEERDDWLEMFERKHRRERTPAWEGVAAVMKSRVLPIILYIEVTRLRGDPIIAIQPLKSENTWDKLKPAAEFAGEDSRERNKPRFRLWRNGTLAIVGASALLLISAALVRVRTPAAWLCVGLTAVTACIFPMVGNPIENWGLGVGPIPSLASFRELIADFDPLALGLVWPPLAGLSLALLIRDARVRIGSVALLIWLGYSVQDFMIAWDAHEYRAALKYAGQCVSNLLGTLFLLLVLESGSECVRRNAASR